MSYKVYTKENTLYVVNNADNKEVVAHKKNVLIDRVSTSGTTFVFKGIDPFISSPANTLELSEIQDESGTPYILNDFLLFRDTETGGSSLVGADISATTSTQRTPVNVIYQAAETGTIPAGFRYISIFNSGNTDALINGVVWRAGKCESFEAGGQNDTLGAITYDAQATVLEISTF